MQLSNDFTLEELTATSHNVPNKPNATQIEALKRLCSEVLQPVRDMYGKSINVNSGFRTLKVNKLVGSKSLTSQHLFGEAADLDTLNDNALIFRLLRDMTDFDQLIWEGGDDKSPAWVHVSYRRGRNRHEVLRFSNGKYTKLTKKI